MITGLRGTLLSQHFAEHELAARFGGRLGEDGRQQARDRLRRWWRGSASTLGPASGLRAVFDLGVLPLVRALGFTTTSLDVLDQKRLVVASLAGGGGTPVGLVGTAWGERLDRAWLEAVRHGIRLDAAWCLSANGQSVRLVDARRSYGRAHLEIDLAAAFEEEQTFAVLWGLLRADAFDAAPGREPGRCLLEEILECSALHAAGVSRSLRHGVVIAVGDVMRGLVHAAGGGRRAPAPALVNEAFGESLTVIYRILFLLFAEARGLVPIWHRVYRDSYSIEALRDLVQQPRAPTGTWEALLAVARLVHGGCAAGDLRVAPFNGRLFSPAHTPLAESAAVDDRAAAGAVRALSTSRGRGAGAGRITYRDLGVEQLGAVYETVLDYAPTVTTAGGAPRVELQPGSGARKTTGTFYTPTAVTDYLVRRTLHPLVAGASAEAILDLRVADPAMGSGAFLVAACRYLSAAYESALVAEGACHASDVTEADRAGFRRTVAQRCLFGVDLNPMAVQLARLSIWLATLAADRPLTFLDHHLLAGDSLVGASLADVARQPPGRASAGRTPRPLPLFGELDLATDLERIVPARLRLAREPADTVAAVRTKEETLAAMARRGGALERWRALADCWCAWWFQPPGDRPPAAGFGEIADAVVGRPTALPAPLVAGWLAAARAAAERHRFFHWTLEFPEVFFDGDGRGSPQPGFDAVVTNPPWDMLRDDGSARPPAGAGAPRSDRRSKDKPGTATPRRAETGAPWASLVAFARESGTYRCQSSGHANRFQLFVERAAGLCRRGGRIGLVVPWGLASDHGCAKLRRMLFDRSQLDGLVCMENSRAVFPIHRSVRFLLLTATMGGRTESLQCRLGERDAGILDALPDRGTDARHYPVALGRSLIERLSGDTLAVPDLRSPADVALFEKVSARFPPLGGSGGWSLRFGRELNATDDRPHFRDTSSIDSRGEQRALAQGRQAEGGRRKAGRTGAGRPSDEAGSTKAEAGGRGPQGGGREAGSDEEEARGGGRRAGQKAERLPDDLPIVEGKHLDPFVAHLDRSRLSIRRDVAARLIDPALSFGRPRLAYRDVASATNRLTLIAAPLPAGCVTTHTVFCSKTALDGEAIALLCGILNSYVANYLVRPWVVTHVGAGIIDRLPVPGPDRGDPLRRAIAARARALASDPADARRHAELQALVARLYALTPAEFEHVLSTFPLVDAAIRREALAALQRAAPSLLDTV